MLPILIPLVSPFRPPEKSAAKVSTSWLQAKSALSKIQQQATTQRPASGIKQPLLLVDAQGRAIPSGGKAQTGQYGHAKSTTTVHKGKAAELLKKANNRIASSRPPLQQAPKAPTTYRGQLANIKKIDYEEEGLEPPSKTFSSSSTTQFRATTTQVPCFFFRIQ